MIDQASVYVIEACERDKTRLADAIADADTDTIIRIKNRAEQLRVHTLHEHLGTEANLAAAELMRRAERALGLALRRGQADGTVHTIGSGRSEPGRKHTTEFMPRGKTTVQVLALVDGISDDDFEAALAKARAAGNLSRVQVLKILRNTVPALPKPKRAYIRQPLPTYAAESGWLLRKAVERIERTLADKRYPENKDKVAEQLHGHLTHAIETLSKVLERITTPNGD